MAAGLLCSCSELWLGAGGFDRIYTSRLTSERQISICAESLAIPALLPYVTYCSKGCASSSTAVMTRPALPSRRTTRSASCAAWARSRSSQTRSRTGMSRRPAASVTRAGRRTGVPPSKTPTPIPTARVRWPSSITASSRTSCSYEACSNRKGTCSGARRIPKSSRTSSRSTTRAT